MKIQSNLDLCNFELQNFCVQSYTNTNNVEPTLARMLFVNGNENSDFSDRLVIYNGTGWKSFAYMDDIEDIATNTDFLALKARVDAFLDGEVDSDGVLENLKEIQAFLDNYSSATDLSDILDTKADKTQLADYLPLSGGTITFSGLFGLTLERTSNDTNLIHFTGGDEDFGYIGFAGVGNPVYADYNGIRYTLLHEGNIGDYALKIDGSNEMQGNLSMGSNGILFSITAGDNQGQLGFINSNIRWYDGTYWHILGYKSDIDKVRAIAESALAKDSFDRIYADAIDSDVVSATTMYADTFTGNATSATKLQTARTIWGQSFDGTGDVSGNLYLGTGTIRSSKSGTDRTLIDFGSAGDPYFGYGTSSAGIDTHICGNNVYLHYRTSRTNGLILNSSGNVTIGSSDLAGMSTRLSVDGSFTMWGAYQGNMPTLGDFTNARFKLYGYGSSNTVNWGLFAAVMSSGTVYLQVGGDFGDEQAFNLLLNPLGGNVLIGADTDDGSGAKLQVNGSISLPQTSSIKYNTAGYLTLREGIADKRFLICNPNGLFLGYETTDRRTSIYGNGISLESDTTILGDLNVSNLATLNGGAYIPTGQTIQFGDATNGYVTAEYDSSAKALKFDGNIYATGTVASGNVGDIGSGGGSGSASVRDFSITPTSSKPYILNHELNTWNVIVQIFEKDVNGESWNMVLTDVEINDENNVTVTFGGTITTDYRVHIIGGDA